MKRKPFLLTLCIAGVISFQCNSGDNNSTGSAEKNVAKEPAINNLPVFLFDTLEHFFGNENWQMIDASDTSYLLFSRQNEKDIKVYQYKMDKGDSVNNVTSDISFRKDSVVWLRGGQELILQKIMDNGIEWKSNYGPDTIVTFKKIAADKIAFQQASKKIYLTKTITMSDFMARSRYDYFHGTHYASDTVKFNGKKSKKIPGNVKLH